jgi:hypothetical protein
MKLQAIQNQSPTNGSPKITQEAICLRAYEIYILQGEKPGRETEDWLQAELELNPPHQTKTGCLSNSDSFSNELPKTDLEQSRKQ